MNNRSLQGFTLSELLVSLAILGLIAAFAIPKVLNAVGEGSSRAIGAELYSTIAEAYQSVRAANNGNVPRGTTAQLLVDRMNYSRTAALEVQASTNAITMANGGQIGFASSDNFNDGTIGAIGFWIDPDGSTGTLNTPVTVYLGGDGRIFPALDVYGAGTGTTISPFVAQYGLTTPSATTSPITRAAAGAGTTWFRN
jgi:prepilin-type N-terminal cleavage/methylation domain-containing protein